MSLPPTRIRLAGASLLLATIVAGCGGTWKREGTAGRNPSPDESLMQLFRPEGVYRDLGRLVSATDVPFIGNYAFLPGAGTATTVLVGLSATNRAFSFERSGDAYQARYRVEYTLIHPGEAPVTAGRDGTIRVATLEETLRIDESLILQQPLTVPPGDYRLSVRVSDLGSHRSGVATRELTVPAFGPGAITQPILVYSATPRSARDDSIKVVMNPRGAVAFGGDSVKVYVEAVGMQRATSVPIKVIDSADSVAVAGSVQFDAGRPLQGRLIPLVPDSARLGRIDVKLGDSGSLGDATGVVSLSGNWIVTNFDDLLSLLRYFGHQDQISKLRNADPASRGALWLAFYKSTDPDPQTPENEALDSYFARLGVANQRFRDEGIPGWQTDRGEVYVVLGDPDEKFNNTPVQQGRYVQWEYYRWRITLTFYDATGFGRYRMTTESRADFERVKNRIQQSRDE